MKLFKCQACGQILHFENHTCMRCGRALGYIPEAGTLSALEPDGDRWRALASEGIRFRFCANAAHGTCNWLIAASSPAAFCLACRHNGVIPDLSDPARLAAWRMIEAAKHRLFYTLVRLGLPLATRAEDPEHGLVFEFLADPPAERGPKVMTGHDNGRVTIALAEADDSERERRRTEMGEPYRTLLGHFRHEIGHHFWDILVRDGGPLDECRRTFGDDRQDYGEALARHYRDGPPPGWQETHVSAYATTHPWEDFAETWAHYLHIVDTLEMAEQLGVRLEPRLDETGTLSTAVDTDPYRAASMQEIVAAWVPVTFALNSINRCMGLPDLYPFVLTPPVVAKLGFVHGLVHRRVPNRGTTGSA
ncbi:zinc-binding metallopeptidase family protein [Propylenella binzhouense]|uniref:Zinc-ribbon domain-containing protein n=1 Tax=Propylenella binzhouense TaxID=2555902 RepID=A0A964WUX6_9HYPH|nr:putative zinc-binding peptidase [Propylenella binzhouense]MYZ49473.1 hypothetical protein [Propylenella binzhouense]